MTINKPLTFIVTQLRNAKLVSGLIILVSLTALASAYTSQYVFGLEPCVLCLYQRIPFMVTALLGVIALIMAFKETLKPAAFLIALSALTFLVGSGIAFYHTGVEQHWWVSALEGCKLDFGGSTSGTPLLDQIRSTPSVPCDEIPWQDPVIGLSMAAWNSIVSFGLFCMSLLSAVMITRRANGL